MKRRFVYTTYHYIAPPPVVVYGNMSAGNVMTTLNDKNGKGWGWGYNGRGAIGDNTTASRSTPVGVAGATKTFCRIQFINNHSMGLDKNGKVWCWGMGHKGQIGNNNIACVSTPVALAGVNKTFCKIGISGYFDTTAIDKYGKVWGWGYNRYGIIGDNTVTSQRTPKAVAGVLKTFCDISAGSGFAIAVDKNNKTWGWGYNSKGGLGINSIVCKCTPTAILGANKTFCKIAAKFLQSFGIDPRGKLWGWGYNTAGLLGDNTIISKSTPIAVGGVLKTFCEVAAGQYHTLAVDSNGKLWAWGNNANGELGDNTIISKSTPIAVCGARTWKRVAAGYGHSAAIDIDGNYYTWGINNWGQIGNNTRNINRSTPILIKSG